MQCFKVNPLKHIDTRYQITRHAPTIVTQKEHSYSYNKNKRSSSKTPTQKLDVAEISIQGLNALKQHVQSGPPAEIGETHLSYISKLITNYER